MDADSPRAPDADGALMAQVRPAYRCASLADVLPGVLAALGVQAAPGVAPEAAVAPDGENREPDPLGLAAGALLGVRRIAVLLVDGLGWHQLRKAPQAATLSEIAAGRLGSLRRLTCGFPSTTPTSLVSLGTGATPGAHGVLGFTLRVPGTGRLLNHVRWSDDPDPTAWQPVQTRLDEAVAAGAAVTVVSRPEFDGSGLTVAAYGRAARYRGAASADQTATEMLAALAEASAPSLVYGYHPDLDKAGHMYGVDSPQWLAAAADVDRLIERLAAGLPAGAALVVTADHGMLDVPAECRIDCDADPRLRSGVEMIGGEPRARHLYTVPGAADDVIATWRAALGPAADVLARDEAIATGWFGPVTTAHRNRAGDAVVVCRDRYAVLATATEPASIGRFVGFHGSLTAAEMEIPLIVIGPR